MLWLGIDVIMLAEKETHFFSRLRGVCFKLHVSLLSIKLSDKNLLTIRSPRYISQISLSCIRSFQIGSFTCFHIINTQCYMMDRRSCHRVILIFTIRSICINMQNRIWFNHRLVHTIEGYLLTIWAPENAFMNTKLILMYRLTIDNFSRPI